MDKVTQRTAAAAEESAAASEELGAQAGTSMAAIRRLEALVGGGAAETSRTGAGLPVRWSRGPAADRPSPIAIGNSEAPGAW